MPKIAQSEGFADLLKTRPVARTKRLMLHCLYNDEPYAFGILVPKRFAKRAIDRNTLKRLIREACRNEVKLEKGRLLVRLTKSLVFVGEMDRIKWWEEIRQLLSSLSSH